MHYFYVPHPQTPVSGHVLSSLHMFKQEQQSAERQSSAGTYELADVQDRDPAWTAPGPASLHAELRAPRSTSEACRPLTRNRLMFSPPHQGVQL